MDNPKLLYLSILLIVILSSYLMAMRDNLPKLIKSASAWVIIFSCFVVGYGLCFNIATLFNTIDQTVQ